MGRFAKRTATFAGRTSGVRGARHRHHQARVQQSEMIEMIEMIAFALEREQASVVFYILFFYEGVLEYLHVL